MKGRVNMRKIKFIHTADLHLDSPFIGLKHLPDSLFKRLKESTFTAFQKMVSTALKESVDFVLIAGDLYDGEERSLKAQLKLKNGFEQLKEAGIDVFIIHGNHDHMGGRWIELEWPENVHVFSNEHVEVKQMIKNGERLANIYGYSYPSRAVTKNITDQFNKVSHANDIFHIGMLHGTIEGDKEHDRYCPFRLHELIEKKLDYWALGHIHKRQIVHEYHPTIVYPGNIQGRNRKEIGEKGFYLVELEEDESKLSFICTSDIIWTCVSVSIEELSNMSEFIKTCGRLVEQIRTEQKGTFLTIHVIGTGPLAHDFQGEQTIEDLRDHLNEVEGMRNDFVWVISIFNETNINDKPKEQVIAFLEDLEKTADQYNNFDAALSPLVEHSIFRKYGLDFTDEEKQQLLNEAKSYLYKELIHYKGEKK